MSSLFFGKKSTTTNSRDVGNPASAEYLSKNTEVSRQKRSDGVKNFPVILIEEINGRLISFSESDVSSIFTVDLSKMFGARYASKLSSTFGPKTTSTSLLSRFRESTKNISPTSPNHEDLVFFVAEITKAYEGSGIEISVKDNYKLTFSWMKETPEEQISRTPKKPVDPQEGLHK